jgi:hypothetical protein
VGGEENESSGDLIQLIFHPARRHHLVLLYPQEILILDLDIQQTVAAVTLEKSAALFAQVIFLPIIIVIIIIIISMKTCMCLYVIATVLCCVCYLFVFIVFLGVSAASERRAVVSTREWCC